MQMLYYVMYVVLHDSLPENLREGGCTVATILTKLLYIPACNQKQIYVSLYFRVKICGFNS